MIKTITAYAPATCANVAVGFDILGFACDFIGDEVTLTLREDKQILIEKIDSAEILPFDITKNTAAVVIKEMVEKLQLNMGFTLHIKKGIPLSSGLGGSAASAVAAAVACNGFLKKPLTNEELLPYILCGEAVASGEAHADNIAPCLYGGLTLITSLHPLNIISLPIPEIFCVFVHPHLKINTKEARSLLTPTILLKDHIKQTQQLAGFLVALYQNNKKLLRYSLTDFVIEPQRAQLVPHFQKLKTIALEKGALGMSLSGSGPTLFAWTEKEEVADLIGLTFSQQFQREKIKAEYWVSKITNEGAKIVKINESE
ncbi:MAG: homoserine kinase [Gammaproteobacteria bacterium]|nr:homoserine kinase [Gammaproteobacteria bacterium]